MTWIRRFFMSDFTYTTSLRFHNIGQNHRLNLPGLIDLLQEAAGRHADSIGFGLNNIDKTDLTWLVLYWKIKILSTPKWNSKIIIKTWAREIERVHSFRDFEIYDEDGNKIAIATSKWVLIRVSTHSIARVPKEIHDTYGVVEKSAFSNPIEATLKEPENTILTFEYSIARRDIDYNGHVNNLFYIDFALEALPENVYVNNFTQVEVLYKKEILPNTKIKCFYSSIEDTHIVTIKSEDLSTLHAIVKLY